MKHYKHFCIDKQISNWQEEEEEKNRLFLNENQILPAHYHFYYEFIETYVYLEAILERNLREKIILYIASVAFEGNLTESASITIK